MTAEEKQRRRKLAHKFHHPHSDALSSARALVVGSLRTIPFTFVSFHTRVGCDVMRLFQLFFLFLFQTLRYIQCGWFFFFTVVVVFVGDGGGVGDDDGGVGDDGGGERIHNREYSRRELRLNNMV